MATAGTGEKWSPRFLTPDRVGYVGGGPEGGIEFTTGPAGARGEFGSPSWSPDGRQLVFSGANGGFTNLYRINTDGTGFAQLTDDRFGDLQPQLSPDGTRIAFAPGPGTGDTTARCRAPNRQIARPDLPHRPHTPQAHHRFVSGPQPPFREFTPDSRLHPRIFAVSLRLLPD